nr:LysR family transcriptional regulator [Mycobacterium shottsii]
MTEEVSVLFRQLEYFVAVAQERHFARAAEKCYVSQPARDASSQDACETWFMHQVRNAREIWVRWWSCF